MRVANLTSLDLVLIKHCHFAVYQQKGQTHKTISLSILRNIRKSAPSLSRVAQFTSHARDVFFLTLPSLALISISFLTIGTVHDKNVTQYTVHHGDSLWTIAEQEDPSDSPRGVVEWMMQRNHLPESADIYPGEKLITPVHLPVT